MFRFIIVFLHLLPLSGFSQLHIGMTKIRVKQELNKKNLITDSTSAAITETDSTLVMKVRGNSITEADYIFSFDKSGKCSAEKTITWCDTCHERLLQLVLAVKKYRWKKLNLNQYVSGFSAGVFVEIQVKGNTYSFTIFRLNLNRKMYRFLLKNK